MEAIPAPLGWHSRGYLPHFDGGAIAQAITFLLADALPKELLLRWENEFATLSKEVASREKHKRIERFLDSGSGARWLREPQIARLIEQALLNFDGERYGLHAWVVMPNHVHVLMTPFEGFELSAILHSWKSYTSKEANRLLHRTGQFWQEGYFDRYIRTEEHYRKAVEYIESNPVMAGLCERKEDWPFGSAAHK